MVLSPEAYNRKTGLALFSPITNSVKGYPFEVLLPSGLPIAGAVLSDHVKSLDWRARKAHLICRLPGEVVRRILQRVVLLLG